MAWRLLSEDRWVELNDLLPIFKKGRCAMVAARKILVVDDEPMVTKSCRRILAGEGNDVETTESGKEGLKRALSEHFDLVMTDLRMPDLDGMELVRTLRRERPQTPIVVITGYGTIPSAVAAVKLGVSDYVEKPFAPPELLEAVHKALPAEEPETRIQADMVRATLERVSQDQRLGDRLMDTGSAALSALPLSSEARAAIVSGDIAWIEKQCGKLSARQRAWLEGRLEAEKW